MNQGFISQCQYAYFTVASRTSCTNSVSNPTILNSTHLLPRHDALFCSYHSSYVAAIFSIMSSKIFYNAKYATLVFLLKSLTLTNLITGLITLPIFFIVTVVIEFFLIISNFQSKRISFDAKIHTFLINIIFSVHKVKFMLARLFLPAILVWFTYRTQLVKSSVLMTRSFVSDLILVLYLDDNAWVILFSSVK